MWNNKQQGEHIILCKLDRAMMNQSWHDGFSNAATDYLPAGQFDH